MYKYYYITTKKLLRVITQNYNVFNAIAVERLPGQHYAHKNGRHKK